MAQPETPESKILLRPPRDIDVAAFYERFPDDPLVHRFGEKSTSYLDSEEAGITADLVFDEPKYVAVLREPVARAISHYRFTQANGREVLTMADAFTDLAESREWSRDSISVSPYHYLRRGKYVEYLRPWMKRWGPDRVFVAIHERLLADPEHLAELEHFLGVTRADRTLPGIVNAAAVGTDLIPTGIVGDLEVRFAAANDELRDLLDDPIDEWD